MDFNNYADQLNQLSNQENLAELESFYTLHSSVLQFFKAIDKTIQVILNKSSVTSAVIKQFENALPALTKLKREITMLDTDTLNVPCKNKINQVIAYIKDDMAISEVDDMAEKFFDLLKQNESNELPKTKSNDYLDTNLEKNESNKFSEIKLNDYSDIKYVMQKVLKAEIGWGTISVNNYWVQFLMVFSRDKNGVPIFDFNKLRVEAASSYGMPEIGNKDYEFMQLGFRRDHPDDNYCRNYILSNVSIDQIIQEIKTIFETIYNVNFLDYEAEESEEQYGEYYAEQYKTYFKNRKK
jgi:hypothetical protein